MEYLASNHIVENICKAIRVHPRYMDDLIQDIYLIILQSKKEIDIHQINFWLVRVIKNQYYGGPFYKRWRSHRHIDIEEIKYKI